MGNARGVQRERLPLGEHTTLQAQSVKCSVLHFCETKVLTLPSQCGIIRATSIPSADERQLRRAAEQNERSATE